MPKSKKRKTAKKRVLRDPEVNDPTQKKPIFTPRDITPKTSFTPVMPKVGVRGNRGGQ